MKGSKKLRLRGVAWTLLSLVFLLLALLAVTDWNWYMSILCLICFLAFASANMRAQRFYSSADFIAGQEAMEEGFKKIFGDKK